MDNLELLKYIHNYTIQNGYPPSIREIGAHFELNTITVSGICTGLKQLGYLTNIRRKARTLVLTEKGLEAIGCPEVTIINDKAYVRLTEYQDLQYRLSKRICELQADLSTEKSRCEQLKTL